MQKDNLLCKHGSLRVAKNKKYLEHEDGTPFFWLADTWWYGMTGRASWNDFKVLVADRKKKGFTVIQTVVGVPPEIDIFSKHAANSGGLPFVLRPKSKQRFWSRRFAPSQNDYDLTINLKYFDEVDKKIKNLVDNGFVPCIFGAWGHHIDILGVNLIKKWWGEIVKRYAKYPVVWCLTGEADIFPPSYSPHDSLIKKVLSKTPIWINSFLLKAKKTLSVILMRQMARKNLSIYLSNSRIRERSFANAQDDKLNQRLKKWDEVARYIKKIDPYKRLLTVHIHSRTTAAKLFNNPAWLDIDSIQSGHSKDSLDFMKKAIREASNNGRPIINLEPWYEGILGNFGEKEQLQAFWACIEAGAAGHSYGAHGIWQMATKRDNFMGHWGKSDWKKALNFPGSTALSSAKKLYLKKVKNPIIV